MKGYKVFNPDWTCRDMQYEVGKTYRIDGSPEICKQGFHFCANLIDCFKYYTFDRNNKVAEIEALGDIDISDISKEDCKYCTNYIKILREIPWEEVCNIIYKKADGIIVKDIDYEATITISEKIDKESLCTLSYCTESFYVTPTLTCDLTSTNLKIGDKLLLADYVWTVVTEDMIRCDEGINMPLSLLDKCVNLDEQISMEQYIKGLLKE